MNRQQLKAAKNAKRDLTLLLGMVKRQRQAWARQGADGYDPREAAQLWASWRLGWRRLTRRNSQVLQLDGLSRISALLGDVRPRDYATIMRDVNEVYERLKHLTVQGYNLGVIKGAKNNAAKARSDVSVLGNGILGMLRKARRQGLSVRDVDRVMDRTAYVYEMFTTNNEPEPTALRAVYNILPRLRSAIQKQDAHEASRAITALEIKARQLARMR